MQAPSYAAAVFSNGLTIEVIDGPPRGDAFITSTSTANLPEHSSWLVLEAAGIDPNTLPSLVEGPATLLLHGKTPVLVIQMQGDQRSTELLRQNMQPGLEQLRRISGRTLYVPLLGTGAAGLDYFASAAILVEALGAWQEPTFEHVLLAAPDASAAAIVSGALDSLVVRRKLRQGSSGEAVVMDDASRVMVESASTGNTWQPAPEPLPANVQGDLNEVLALATVMAQVAGRAEGADGALLFAAFMLLEPLDASKEELDALWEEPLGAESPHSRVLQALARRGVEKVPGTPKGGWASATSAHHFSSEARPIVTEERLLRDEGVHNAIVPLLVRHARVGGPASVEPFLRDMGSSGVRFREFVRRFAHSAPFSTRARLLELLQEHSPRVGELSMVANDQPRGADQLEIGNDVAALADVIAAAARTPPLAVGLFGDWGSGKSFFINQLRQRLELLSESARACAEVGKETAYCKRVLHVDFNAWQYVDGNLWANLVYRVFEALSISLFGSASDQDERAVEENRKKLFSQLALSKEQLAESTHLSKVAKEAVKQAEDRQVELERRRDQAVKRLLAPSPADVMKTVLKLPTTARLVNEFCQLWGASPGGDVMAQLREAHSELGSSWGRIASVWRRLRQRSALYTLLAAVAIGAGLVALLAKRLLTPSIELLTPSLSVGGLAILGLIGPFTQGLQRAKRVLGVVEAAEKEVNEQLSKEQVKLSKERAAAQEEVAEANKQLLKVEDETRLVRQRIAELDAEMGRISAGHRVREFIRERSAGADYRQHLGIVSTIRNDFERLKGLLERLQKTDATSGETPIDRVVLYVDDLDRCPADRVVEVLQAVNLLLDFPLFVAVVAVDARWLLKSLSVHYAPQLGRRQSRGVSLETAWASTPQNFLEKIFQIPLTLRPMDRDGYCRLVRQLMPVTAEPSAELVPLPVPPARSVVAGPPRPTPAASSDASPAQVPVGTRQTDHEPQPGLTGGSLAPAEHAHGTTIDPNPTVLQIQLIERQFLERLSGVLHTPRSVKRLINLYWLTRASLQEHEVKGFVGTAAAPGSFRMHLVLLALMVGYPALVGALFDALLEHDPTPHDDDAEPADSSLDPVVSRVRELLGSPEHQDSMEPFLEQFMRLVELAQLPLKAEAYQTVVRRVMRFSFRPTKRAQRLRPRQRRAQLRAAE